MGGEGIEIERVDGAILIDIASQRPNRYAVCPEQRIAGAVNDAA